VTPLPVPIPPASNTHEDIPTSELLVRIVERCAGDEVSVGELIDGLGERAFGIILLLLTVPAAVPGPPGIPTAFAVPILLVAAQIFLKRRSVWFPGFVRRRRVSRTLLLAILRRVQPTLRRLEGVCRPRLLLLTGPRAERWIGAFIFLCGLVLLNPIPIPFSHIPLAVAMVILSLGYVERDGYVLIAGGIGALFGIAFNVSLMGGILVMMKKLLGLFRP
jgi:hypothetical protein